MLVEEYEEIELVEQMFLLKNHDEYQVKKQGHMSKNEILLRKENFKDYFLILNLLNL
jgi:hypothetical protein